MGEGLQLHCVSAAFAEQALYTTPWTNGNLVKVRRLDLKSQSRLGKEAGQGKWLLEAIVELS